MRNMITQLKDSLEGFNKRLEQTEEIISKLEYSFLNIDSYGRILLLIYFIYNSFIVYKLYNKKNKLESALARWMNLEPVITQCSKSEREKQI